MTWLLRQRFRNYVRNSNWLFPVVGLFAGLFLVQFLHKLETQCGWRSEIDPDDARTVLAALASSMFTFVIFVSSALLIAFQLASAQLSPRLIAIVFRDPVMKWSLTLFVFTFAVTMAALVRVGDGVTPMTTRLAQYSFIASFAAFLHLIDHVAKVLRPSGAMRSVARIGRLVIEDVYPRLFTDRGHESPDATPAGLPTESELIVTAPFDGAVLA